MPLFLLWLAAVTLLLVPVTALLFQYIVWRATLKTLWNNGIDWRGMHYSLQELKAN